MGAKLQNFDAQAPNKTFISHCSPGDRPGFFASEFGALPMDIRGEEAGVNLFAFCREEK